MYPTFRRTNVEDATADERRGIVVTGQGKGADQQSCGGLTNIVEV